MFKTTSCFNTIWNTLTQEKEKILEYLNNYKVKLNVSIPPLTCTDFR